VYLPWYRVARFLPVVDERHPLAHHGEHDGRQPLAELLELRSLQAFLSWLVTNVMRRAARGNELSFQE